MAIRPPGQRNLQSSNNDTASSMFELFERIRQEGLSESELQGGIEQKTPFNQGSDSIQETQFSERKIEGRVDTRPQVWGPPLENEIEKRKSYLQRVMPQIYKRINDVKEGKYQLEDNYANNFIINYHSHQNLLPVPLQMFATDVNIVHQTDAPYESATITVNMGFDTAAVVFAGEDGHPSPGGWILIRHKSTSDEELVSVPEESRNKAGRPLSNVAPAVFLGTVSSIDWNISGDQNGTMQCIVTLTCNSFIHNIMQGEYGTTGGFLLDEQYAFYKSSLSLNPDPEIPLPSQLKLELISEELKKAVDKQLAAQATIDSMTGENPREEFNQTTFEKAGEDYQSATEEIAKLSEEYDAISENYPEDNDYLPGIPTSSDRNIVGNALFKPDGYTTNSFITHLGSYADYISKIRLLLNGTKGKTTYVRQKDGVERKEEDDTFDLKLKPSEALNDMLRKFAYPVMPLSFYAEPFDLEVLFNTYLPANGSSDDLLPSDPDELYENLKLGLFSSNGPTVDDAQKEFIIQSVFLGLVYTYEDINFMRPGSNPIRSGFGPSGTEQFSITDPDYFTNPQIAQPSGNNRNYFSATGGITSPITGDKLDNYLEYAELFQLNLPSIYEGLKLGEVIHVATNRNDVPISSELWASMPKTEQSEIDPLQFSNLFVKNSTIWGLLCGSFQYDPEIVEFYPTIIPLRGEDSRRLPQTVYNQHEQNTKPENVKRIGAINEVGIKDFRPKSSLYNPHPLWHAIGGIPTIVYRLKPMHPILKGTITKDRIDKVRRVQDRARFGGFAIEPLQYLTDFEKYRRSERVAPSGDFSYRVGDEYVDNSYFDRYDEAYGRVIAGQGQDGKAIYASPTSFNEIITGETVSSSRINLDHKMKESNLTKSDKPVRSGLKPIDYNGEYITYKSLNEIALPVFISRQEIKSVRFNQLDTLRVNSVSSKVKQYQGSDLAGEIPHFKSKFVTNLDSALKYGYRPYENVIPQLLRSGYPENLQSAALRRVQYLIDQGETDVSVLYKEYTSILADDQIHGGLYRLGASAERLYMMMGDEQKYFRGSLRCTALLDKDIQPGMWIEIAMASPDSPINPYKATGGGYGVHAGVLFVYVLGVSHSHLVDQNTGLVVAETSINFERGSIGGVIPNFPSRLDNQRINFDKKSKEAVGRQASELQFFKLVDSQIGQGRFNTSGYKAIDFESFENADTPEEEKMAIRQQALTYFQSELSKGNITREEYNNAVDQLKQGFNPLPKDAFTASQTLIDYLSGQGIEPPNKLTDQIKHQQ